MFVAHLETCSHSICGIQISGFDNPFQFCSLFERNNHMDLMRKMELLQDLGDYYKKVRKLDLMRKMEGASTKSGYCYLGTRAAVAGNRRPKCVCDVMHSTRGLRSDGRCELLQCMHDDLRFVVSRVLLDFYAVR
jgi:hypothetical protein